MSPEGPSHTLLLEDKLTLPSDLERAVADPIDWRSPFAVCPFINQTQCSVKDFLILSHTQVSAAVGRSSHSIMPDGIVLPDR